MPLPGDKKRQFTGTYSPYHSVSVGIKLQQGMRVGYCRDIIVPHHTLFLLRHTSARLQQGSGHGRSYYTRQRVYRRISVIYHCLSAFFRLSWSLRSLMWHEAAIRFPITKITPHLQISKFTPILHPRSAPCQNTPHRHACNRSNRQFHIRNRAVIYRRPCTKTQRVRRENPTHSLL